MCELSQAGISSRAYTPGPYSNREDLLYAFDRMIVELHENAAAARGLEARADLTEAQPRLRWPPGLEGGDLRPTVA